MEMLRKRQALQQEQLQNFVATLPELILLSDSATDDDEAVWHPYSRQVADATDYNQLRCYAAPSLAVPGLCGVFAEREVQIKPIGALGNPPSCIVAR